jgi:hypothetical protein
LFRKRVNYLTLHLKESYVKHSAWLPPAQNVADITLFDGKWFHKGLLLNARLKDMYCILVAFREIADGWIGSRYPKKGDSDVNELQDTRPCCGKQVKER